MAAQKILASDALADGEMREVTVADKEILIVRVGDDYFAIGAKCTHYGAPLETGALRGHQVMCPWHHACFDIRDGRQLESPGMDGLPAYRVESRADGVYLQSPDPAAVPKVDQIGRASCRERV